MYYDPLYHKKLTLTLCFIKLVGPLLCRKTFRVANLPGTFLLCGIYSVSSLVKYISGFTGILSITSALPSDSSQSFSFNLMSSSESKLEKLGKF
ncbi:UNVERIFIED_CONTAM: hypothetical protein NCL1_31958 [Trichonephila clavipes]